MDKDRQIMFKYVFPQDYNPVYCNGAYGGVTATGEIIANFFLERMPIPYSTTNNVNDDGTLSETVAIEPEDFDNSIIRYVSTGVVLSEYGARSVYEWLGNQLKILEDRKELQNTHIQESD